MIKARPTLKEQRIKRGLGASDLAALASINHSVICRAERGGGIKPITAKAICDALGANFDDLFIITELTEGVQ